MSETSPRYWEIFFAVFESLPRQGPGNRECTKRALALCGDLGPAPRVLDLGSGTGAQTLHLAALTEGEIVAVDSHAPSIARLGETLGERGLAPRVRALVADMTELPFERASFDLVWSEGALYNLGLERALPLCHGLLRPGGYLAFTDAVWLSDAPPPEVRALFADYPTMGRASDALALLVQRGFEPLGHFTLPEEAWWGDFYTPMLARIAELRGTHAGDAEALSALDALEQEVDLYRRHAAQYGYEFFVARRVPA